MSAGGPPPGVSGPGPARDWRFWTLLGLLGLLLALPLAYPRLDADQAVTGLMGVHVLRGIEIFQLRVKTLGSSIVTS